MLALEIHCVPPSLLEAADEVAARVFSNFANMSAN
jgi:hypothetical protein